MPKVSVNIPVYNGEKYIEETLQSVLDQTFQDFEIILVDDGSTDRSAEIVKGSNDKRIKYVFQQNQGIGGARNTALKNSRGKYIAFLDQDDLWLPAKLQKQIELFERRPELGLVFCNTTFFNNLGRLHEMYEKPFDESSYLFPRLLKKYFLSLETVMIDRDVLEKVGTFPEKMMMAEEYNLFLKVAYFYDLGYVNGPLAMYRIHDKNYSWGKELQEIDEIRETLRQLEEMIPGFRTSYSGELLQLETGNAVKEGLASWKAGKNKDASAVFFRAYRRMGRSRHALLSFISLFVPFPVFAGFVKRFAGKRLNSFVWD